METIRTSAWHWEHLFNRQLLTAESAYSVGYSAYCATNAVGAPGDATDTQRP